MMLTIFAVLAAIVVGALAIAATKPDQFRIERALAVKAAPEKLYPLIANLHAHLRWSPFEKDPAMKRSFSGAESGKGATYEWDGNNKVGAGRIVITDTTPPSRVTMSLEMYRPFKANNLVDFTIEPNGDTTKVAWSMQGRQPFMAKLVSVFINCDKMVGKEFEAGLASLKTLAES